MLETIQLIEEEVQPTHQTRIGKEIRLVETRAIIELPKTIIGLLITSKLEKISIIFVSIGILS